MARPPSQGPTVIPTLKAEKLAAVARGGGRARGVGQPQSGIGHHTEFASQGRRRGRPTAGDLGEHSDHCQRRQPGDGPERRPPAQLLTDHGARGQPDDGRDGEPARDDAHRAAAQFRSHQAQRGGRRERPESGVDEGAHYAGTEQHPVVAGQRAEHVRGDEDREEGEHGVAARPPQGEHGQQRCADEHAEGEARDQQARTGNGDPEVGGQFGQESGEHELGGALGEDRQAENMDGGGHRASLDTRLFWNDQSKMRARQWPHRVGGWSTGSAWRCRRWPTKCRDRHHRARPRACR